MSSLNIKCKDSLCLQLWRQPREQLWQQLDGQLPLPLSSKLWRQLEGPLRRQLRERFWRPLDDQLREDIYW